jgi:hypothetical protein
MRKGRWGLFNDSLWFRLDFASESKRSGESVRKDADSLAAALAIARQLNEEVMVLVEKEGLL